MKRELKSEVKSAIITVPDKITVYEDQRTKAKSVAFPFSFFSGEHGVVTVTKLNKALSRPKGWVPTEDIKQIIIIFN